LVRFSKLEYFERLTNANKMGFYSPSRTGEINRVRNRHIEVRYLPPSHPFLSQAIVRNLRLTGPEIPAFRAFNLVSRLPVSDPSVRNDGKSLALPRKIPVLRRLLAETGSITTAAWPWHSVSVRSPVSTTRNREIFAGTAARGYRSEKSLPAFLSLVADESIDLSVCIDLRGGRIVLDDDELSGVALLF
jgi:hypothetical protein